MSKLDMGSTHKKELRSNGHDDNGFFMAVKFSPAFKVAIISDCFTDVTGETWALFTL